MAIFEDMSTIEKEEFIVSLAALLCADAKVEVSVEIRSGESFLEGKFGRCY